MKVQRVVTDEQAAEFCASLPSPLREDVAGIIQWDYGPENMPMTKQLAKIFGREPPLPHASRQEIEDALRMIGYHNPSIRVATPDETRKAKMLAMRRLRSRRQDAKRKTEKERKREEDGQTG